MLAVAYSLLSLTLVAHISHAEVMQRCVLIDPNVSRIWSVANIEVGLAYLGVFAGMLFYFIGIYKRSVQHLKDLTYALVYLYLFVEKTPSRNWRRMSSGLAGSCRDDPAGSLLRKRSPPRSG